MVATAVKLPSITWEPLPIEYVLPDDPVENIQQPQRAALESQRADQEYQRAEQERQRAEMLAAKFQKLGIDPNNLEINK